MGGSSAGNGPGDRYLRPFAPDQRLGGREGLEAIAEGDLHLLEGHVLSALTIRQSQLKVAAEPSSLEATRSCRGLYVFESG